MQGNAGYDVLMDAITLSKQTVGRIRARLEELGWTQSRLADEIGVRPPHINRVLKADRPVELETVARIAAALGLQAEELLSNVVPLKGVVSAGDGEEEEYPLGTTLPVHTLYPPGTVAYLVRGTSMEDELIADGDYILVRPTPEAESGEKVVVFIPDVGTLVKLKRKSHYAGANKRQPREPFQFCEGCREYGVLVGVIRKC